MEPYGGAIDYPNYPVFAADGSLYVSDSGMWDADDYVVESTRPGVVKVPRHGGEVTIVVKLDQVIPDGLAFDVEGGLWISCWQPNRIMRLAPNGALDIVADDWSGLHVLTPNNLAFAGHDLAELAFPALGGNFIRAFAPGVTGQALNYPEVAP